MRAVVARELGPPGILVVDDVGPRRPGPGEILVDCRAAAVNFPDLLVVAGRYQVRPPLPFTPGKEASGVVRETGGNVTRFRPGDRVMAQVEWGAWAEEVVVGEAHCYPVPDGVDFEQAAAVGIAFQTAHFALHDRAGAKAGDRVLVTGASGSVGLAALQLAAAAGCETIAGLTTVGKSDVALANGARHVVDLSDGDPRESIRRQIASVTGGGVDVVIEMLGGETFDGAVRALGFGGRLVVVGFASGAIPTLRANYALLKNIAVTGLNWAEYREREPERVRRVQAELFDLVAAGKLRMPIQEVFPLDEAVAACNVLAERRVRGKVVLSPGARRP